MQLGLLDSGEDLAAFQYLVLFARCLRIRCLLLARADCQSCLDCRYFLLWAGHRASDNIASFDGGSRARLEMPPGYGPDPGGGRYGALGEFS